MKYKVTKCISKRDTEKPRTALKLCFLKKKKRIFHLLSKNKTKQTSSTLKMVGWFVLYVRNQI